MTEKIRQEINKLVEEAIIKVKPLKRTLIEIIGPVTSVVEVGQGVKPFQK